MLGSIALIVFSCQFKKADLTNQFYIIDNDLFMNGDATAIHNDSVKLSQFIQSAGHVCAALLEEEDAYRQSRRTQGATTSNQVQTQISHDVFTCGSKFSLLQGK